MTETAKRDLMPVIFLAHGAPYFTRDNGEMVGVDVMFSAAHAVKPEGARQPMSAEETSPLGPQSQLLPTL